MNECVSECVCDLVSVSVRESECNREIECEWVRV